MADKSNDAGLGDDDSHLDLRPLLRIGGWGAGATFAILLAIFVGNSDSGTRRAGVAVAALTGSPSEQSLRTTGAELLARADSDRETRRLNETLRVLASDRDRLAGRLALLERNLEDLTGSVARQSSTARPPSANAGNGRGNGSGPAPVASAPETIRPQDAGAQHPPPKAAAPYVLPPASPAAVLSPEPQPTASQAPRPQAPGPSTSVAHAPLPPPVGAPNVLPVIAPTPPARTLSPGALPITAPFIGPTEDSLLLSALPLIMPKEPAPDVVPLPRPGPVAMLQAYANTGVPAVPIPASASERAGNDAAAPATEFAVDLGPAPNLNAVRALWDRIKARQGATLDGLRPLVNIRDGARPGTTELRLVAGPLANPAAVARICAALIAAALPCQPGVFDGQRLAQR